MKLGDIAQHIGAKISDDCADISISGVASLGQANGTELSFICDNKHLNQLKTTKAAAVITSDDLAASASCPTLVVSNPYLGFAKSAQLFAYSPTIPAGIAASTAVDKTASINPTAHIGEHCYIGANVSIGANVTLAPGCIIMDNTQIGDNSSLMPNVSVYHSTTIGNNCIIHSNTVIGSDGFGNAFDHEKKCWEKIAQCGNVVIKDDVEIGANTCIDRGTLDDTIIEQGVKIDNQVQIAHNVIIGAHTAIAAQVGIAGSSKIGSYCMIAGAVAITGHIEICDHVQITGMSMITRRIKKPGVYSSGIPAREHRRWRRNVARFQRLDKMADKIKTLEQQFKLFKRTNP